MLRELSKTGLAATLHWLGMDRLIGPRTGSGRVPLIISYHRVVEDFSRSARHSIAPMLISTGTLERQLDWILEHYHVVSLDELASELGTTDPLRKPLAAITFDDGYSDVYRNAFPILKRKGIPFAVFVVTDLCGTGEVQLHDELYLLFSAAAQQWRSPGTRMRECADSIGLNASMAASLSHHAAEPFKATRLCLEGLSQARIRELTEALHQRVDVPEEWMRELRSMSWEMLEELADHGVTIGSHTRSHALLANESQSTILEELRGSRQALESRLGREVRHFAYPDGRFDEKAVQGVAQAGFRYAYTTCNHRDRDNPLLTIPRRVFWEKSCLNSFGHFSPSILSCQVNGIFDPAARCEQEHWA